MTLKKMGLRRLSRALRSQPRTRRGSLSADSREQCLLQNTVPLLPPLRSIGAATDPHWMPRRSDRASALAGLLVAHGPAHGTRTKGAQPTVSNSSPVNSSLGALESPALAPSRSVRKGEVSVGCGALLGPAGCKSLSARPGHSSRVRGPTVGTGQLYLPAAGTLPYHLSSFWAHYSCTFAAREAAEGGQQTAEARQERCMEGAGSLPGEEQQHCSECGRERESQDSPFLCGGCGALLPLDPSIDHFALFGLAPEFHIDKALLEAKYKQLQRLLHPDKFASSAHSAKDQERSALWSSHVIGAYYTLLRPLSRARYLLRNRVDPSFVNEESTLDDQELLLEVMEVREEIEEASPAQLEVLKVKFEGQMEELGDLFASAYGRLDIRACQKLVHRMSYCKRILEEIVEAM